jgi:hypothetical protein
VDESEIGSANETATFGSPFHFSWERDQLGYLTFWPVLSQSVIPTS